VSGKQFELYADCERLIPSQIKPVCQQLVVDVEDFDKNAISLSNRITRKDLKEAKEAKPKRDKNKNIPPNAEMGFTTASDVRKKKAKTEEEKLAERREAAVADEDELRHLIDRWTVRRSGSIRPSPLDVSTLPIDIPSSSRRLASSSASAKLRDKLTLGRKLAADEAALDDWKLTTYEQFNKKLIHWWHDERHGENLRPCRPCRVDRVTSGDELALSSSELPPGSIHPPNETPTDGRREREGEQLRPPPPPQSASMSVRTTTSNSTNSTFSRTSTSRAPSNTSAEKKPVVDNDFILSSDDEEIFRLLSVPGTTATNDDQLSHSVNGIPKPKEAQTDTTKPKEAQTDTKPSKDAQARVSTASGADKPALQPIRRDTSSRPAGPSIILDDDHVRQPPPPPPKPIHSAAVTATSCVDVPSSPPRFEDFSGDYDEFELDEAAILAIDEISAKEAKTKSPADDAELMPPPPPKRRRSGQSSEAEEPTITAATDNGRVPSPPLAVVDTSPIVMRNMSADSPMVTQAVRRPGVRQRTTAIAVEEDDDDDGSDDEAGTSRRPQLTRLRKGDVPGTNVPVRRRREDNSPRQRPKAGKKRKVGSLLDNPLMLDMEAVRDGREAREPASSSEAYGSENSSDRAFLASEEVSEDTDMSTFYRNSLLSQHPAAQKFQRRQLFPTPRRHVSAVTTAGSSPAGNDTGEQSQWSFDSFCVADDAPIEYETGSER
jgi:hypothetical protein